MESSISSPIQPWFDILEGHTVITSGQLMACAFMTVGLAIVLFVEGLPIRHPKYDIWLIGNLSSFIHNIDNILRPGIYWTPTWIARTYLLFPMEVGFAFWYSVLVCGIWALHEKRTKIPIIFHTVGCCVGLAHYTVQYPWRFGALANFTILLEVIAGLVSGWNLLKWFRQENGGGRSVSYAPLSLQNLDAEDNSLASYEGPESESYVSDPATHVSNTVTRVSVGAGGGQSELRNRSRSPSILAQSQ